MNEPDDFQPALEKCPNCDVQMLHHTHFVERYSEYTHWSDHWVILYKCPKCEFVLDKTMVPERNGYDKYGNPEITYRQRSKQ